MTGWLHDWGAPASASGGMAGMGNGMMSAHDMTSLAHLSGAAFDYEFLTMMVGHHSGAIVMAATTSPMARTPTRSPWPARSRSLSRPRSTR